MRALARISAVLEAICKLPEERGGLKNLNLAVIEISGQNEAL